MMERDHQTTLPVVLITWCLSVGSISRTLAAESQVIGSPQPIIAVAGADVILPCSLKPPINAKEKIVTWSRPGMKPEYVHVYRDGRDSVRDQNPSYNKRTSLFKEELIKGNVSLKLSGVKLEDQGNYTCLIPSLNSLVKEAVIQLTVVSEPKISILKVNNTHVVLHCESEGWYPEPQLEWREGPKDSEGGLLSADDTQTDRGPDRLHYTVRSNMTVQKTDTNMVTCRVQLMKFNLKRKTEIHALVFKLIHDAYHHGLWVGLVIGLVIGAIIPALIYLCKKGYKKFAGGKNTPQEKTEGVEEEYLNDKKETN